SRLQTIICRDTPLPPSTHPCPTKPWMWRHTRPSTTQRPPTSWVWPGTWWSAPKAATRPSSTRNHPSCTPPGVTTRALVRVRGVSTMRNSLLLLGGDGRKVSAGDVWHITQVSSVRRARRIVAFGQEGPVELGALVLEHGRSCGGSSVGTTTEGGESMLTCIDDDGPLAASWKHVRR